jgi:hypothetical protein
VLVHGLVGFLRIQNPDPKAPHSLKVQSLTCKRHRRHCFPDRGRSAPRHAHRNATPILLLQLFEERRSVPSGQWTSNTFLHECGATPGSPFAVGERLYAPYPRHVWQCPLNGHEYHESRAQHGHPPSRAIIQPQSQQEFLRP